MQSFAARLIRWHREHGRHDLPWQRTRDPYLVWLSEVMLQQTQVSAVLRYFPRFAQRFPDIRTLAAAPLERVLEQWAGLGYYARARRLHQCARLIVGLRGGRFPDRAAGLAQLPGIGRSTAAAIAAFCFDERGAILDGNVKRVLARHFAIDGDQGSAAVERTLWQQAEALLPPASAIAVYTQAIMDVGATLCTRARPRCDACPVARSCRARSEARTEDLPARRPSRALPVRRAHLLLAVHAQSVLVEQRAPTGVWGGMLSLPEFKQPAQLRRRAAEIAPGVPRRLAQRRHGFTHFTLAFTPHLLHAPAAAPRAADATERWLALDSIERAALPAPILALLRAVRDGTVG